MPTRFLRQDDRLPPHSPGRVLVADPDVDARLLYRTTFHAAGYDVVEASDGRDALTKALVREPALVVTELRLPVIDGFGLYEILRRDWMTANVPILVVTTETRATEVERARQAGADVVLSKLTPLATLWAEARRLLLQSHELRGRSAAARDKAARQVEKSAKLVARSEHQRRTILAKSYQRFTTTTPPTAPPALTCPSCKRHLRYERSHIGGVSDRHPEQWDYFTCATCGVFQYRQRTGKLRHLRDEEVGS